MDFVAQSLDNDSPMIVASDRQLYDEGDVRRSRVLEYTSMVSGVVKKRSSPIMLQYMNIKDYLP